MDGMELATLLPVLAALNVAGAAVGLLAGMFGVGGGAISVPVFFELFRVLGYGDEVAMPMAVGTSLAVIIPTSLNSARGALAARDGGYGDAAALGRAGAAGRDRGVGGGAICRAHRVPDRLRFRRDGECGEAAVRRVGMAVERGLPGRGCCGSMVVDHRGAVGADGDRGRCHHQPVPDAARGRYQAGDFHLGRGGGADRDPGTLGYMAAGWGKPGLPFDALGYVSLLTFCADHPHDAADDAAGGAAGA